MTHTTDITKLLNDDAPLYEVTVEDAQGSTPRDSGSWMLISQKYSWGTIGGGQLEKIALDNVGEMFRQKASHAEVKIPLGPEIGQCCGGRVTLRMSRVDQKERLTIRSRIKNEESQRPHLYIFGAGHTGRALARISELLPVRSIVVDSRTDELAITSKNVEQRLSVLPEAEISAAPPNSAFVIMTHDHALDFLLCSEALARGDAAYVGMIGSNTKRAKFASWARENCALESLDSLHCPMAKDFKGDKRPEVISTFIAAELMDHLVRAKAYK